MAKLTPGALAGSVTGSVGGTTFTHNRYGAVARTRALVRRRTSANAYLQKAVLSQVSRDWQGLTDAQRAAWNTWATVNPVPDALGFLKTLTGHAAYCRINARLRRFSLSTLSTPPIAAAPDPLTTLSIAATAPSGPVNVTFTPTPIGGSTYLFLRAALINSPGITAIDHLAKFCGISGGNQSSAWNAASLVTAVFGTLIAGQTLVALVSVYMGTTGLMSAPLRVEATVA